MIDFTLIENNKNLELIRIWLIDLTASKGDIRPKIYSFI